MKILIVEDSIYKADKLIEYILSLGFSDYHLAKSVTAAKKYIKNFDIDIAILDMTLPMYDDSHERSSSDSQEKGGMEVARYLSKHKPQIFFVFLTQHEYFNAVVGVENLNDIDTTSKAIYGPSYLGSIYYEHSGYDWKLKIKEVLSTR